MSRFIFSALIGAACAIAPAAAVGAPSVIAAKPRFEQRGPFLYLVLSNANQSFDIGWEMLSLRLTNTNPVRLVPLSLDTNRLYTFTVDEVPIRGYTVPELSKVELNGQTIYDVQICEVHNIKMTNKEVEVYYGAIVPSKDAPPADIERRLFPHQREYSLGGCTVTSSSAETTKVYVCSDCREAFMWWSGTATAPYSVLPRATRYDYDQHLRLVYLESYGKGYVAAWARKEALPVFAPTTNDDKARVFGYSDGAAAGRSDRDAWSPANGQRYGPKR